MNYLAIDCGGEYLSLAISKDGIFSDIQLKVGSKQTEFVIPEINKILQINNLALSDLDGILYNQGPASFTGLRIGLSVALSLAYSLNISLMPISSFHLYLAKYLGDIDNSINAKLYVALDARLSQVYFSEINLDGTLINPLVVAPNEINSDGILISNATDIYPGAWLDGFTHVIKSDDYPLASNMFYWLGKLDFIPYTDADLLYLRNKVALNLAEQRALKP